MFSVAFARRRCSRLAGERPRHTSTISEMQHGHMVLYFETGVASGLPELYFT